jgi:undecaprenyl-diphosphatase
VAGWRAWLTDILLRGKGQLARLGLALVLGFGLGVGALVLFADLAEDVMARDTLALDNGVLAWLQQFRSPALDTLMRGLSLMGSEGIAVLLVVLLVYLGFRGRWGAAASLLLVVGGAQLLNDILKDLFQRTRPAPVAGLILAQQFSFPSGHAMVSAAFYLFVAYLGWRLLRGRWRYVLSGGLVVLILLIGISRLYLDAHYFTDVVAGYIAGFLWTDAVVLGGRFLHGPPRRRRRVARPRTQGCRLAWQNTPPRAEARLSTPDAAIIYGHDGVNVGD